MISNFDAVGSLLVAFFVMTDPLMLAVLIGAIQNVFSRSCKYTFFIAQKKWHMYHLLCIILIIR